MPTESDSLVATTCFIPPDPILKNRGKSKEESEKKEEQGHSTMPEPSSAGSILFQS